MNIKEIYERHCKNKGVEGLFGFDKSGIYHEINGEPLRIIQSDIKSVFKAKCENYISMDSLYKNQCIEPIDEIKLASIAAESIQVVLSKIIDELKVLDFGVTDTMWSESLYLYADVVSGDSGYRITIIVTELTKQVMRDRYRLDVIDLNSGIVKTGEIEVILTEISFYPSYKVSNK